MNYGDSTRCRTCSSSNIVYEWSRETLALFYLVYYMSAMPHFRTDYDEVSGGGNYTENERKGKWKMKLRGRDRKEINKANIKEKRPMSKRPTLYNNIA